MRKTAAVAGIIVLVVVVGIGGYLFGREAAVREDNVRLRDILCQDAMERRQASEAEIMKSVTSWEGETVPLVSAAESPWDVSIPLAVARLEDNLLMANHEIAKLCVGSADEAIEWHAGWSDLTLERRQDIARNNQIVR